MHFNDHCLYVAWQRKFSVLISTYYSQSSFVVKKKSRYAEWRELILLPLRFQCRIWSICTLGIVWNLEEFEVIEITGDISQFVLFRES